MVLSNSKWTSHDYFDIVTSPSKSVISKISEESLVIKKVKNGESIWAYAYDPNPGTLAGRHYAKKFGHGLLLEPFEIKVVHFKESNSLALTAILSFSYCDIETLRLPENENVTMQKTLIMRRTDISSIYFFETKEKCLQSFYRYLESVRELSTFIVTFLSDFEDKFPELVI